MENTLFAELLDGTYVAIFSDPGNDDKLSLAHDTNLIHYSAVKEIGGIDQLTGKFIFETKRLTNLEKHYTYDVEFNFRERNNIIRFGGKDRYEVEKNLNNGIPDNSLGAVLLTSGLTYSDALVGSVLNKTKNTTILLIKDNGQVIQSKINEAKRLLKPNGKVYILGGPGSVSPNIEEEMKKHFTVERISGKDRLDVALKVAEMANPTDGLVFSDSLSVSPAATERQSPILPQWGENLMPRIKDYIKSHPTIKKVYIVSGTGVIPVSIENELKAAGIVSIERIAGKDRYDTSLAIAKKFYPSPKIVSLANGLIFADALYGSRYSWYNNSPILLVRANQINFNTDYYMINLRRVALLGGPATLNEELRYQILY
ncbi:cell wall-binding repeat-containing protein [Bacillus sp. JJ1521]|uniref:cell wall-binding repeat-containing protein n=1 Tax=Bacillus sp. JJ1521 TaxID=3122957 RepID=UPI0030007426